MEEALVTSSRLLSRPLMDERRSVKAEHWRNTGGTSEAIAFCLNQSAPGMRHVVLILWFKKQPLPRGVWLCWTPSPNVPAIAPA